MYLRNRYRRLVLPRSQIVTGDVRSVRSRAPHRSNLTLDHFGPVSLLFLRLVIVVGPFSQLAARAHASDTRSRRRAPSTNQSPPMAPRQSTALFFSLTVLSLKREPPTIHPLDPLERGVPRSDRRHVEIDRASRGDNGSGSAQRTRSAHHVAEDARDQVVRTSQRNTISFLAESSHTGCLTQLMTHPIRGLAREFSCETKRKIS